MSEAADINLVVNGKPYECRLPTSITLVDFLRDNLSLHGCRMACDQAVCGACTVLVDGQPRAACATFVWAVSGAAIETIEGLARADGKLHPLQQAFLNADAFQCGFCTSGMILAAKALLDRIPDPDETDIREGLSGNLCRCTGYQMIIEAVASAAATMRSAMS